MTRPDQTTFFAGLDDVVDTDTEDDDETIIIITFT